MHRIDTDGHVSNLFDEGDPGVPRLPTVVDSEILNAFQEELVGLVLDAGISLVKNTNTQVLAACRTLFVRATGTATQTITGLKTFTSQLSAVVGSGLALVVESTENTLEAIATVGNFGNKGGLHGFGFTYGVKGTATSGGANTGILGNGQTGGGAYGVTAQSITSGPGRAALRIVPQDSDPSTGVKGDIYVNTSTGKLMIHDGSSWVVVGSQTA